jgi:hypothetical protein
MHYEQITDYFRKAKPKQQQHAAKQPPLDDDCHDFVSADEASGDAWSRQQALTAAASTSAAAASSGSKQHSSVAEHPSKAANSAATVSESAAAAAAASPTTVAALVTQQSAHKQQQQQQRTSQSPAAAAHPWQHQQQQQQQQQQPTSRQPQPPTPHVECAVCGKMVPLEAFQSHEEAGCTLDLETLAALPAVMRSEIEAARRACAKSNNSSRSSSSSSGGKRSAEADARSNIKRFLVEGKSNTNDVGSGSSGSSRAAQRRASTRSERGTDGRLWQAHTAPARSSAAATPHSKSKKSIAQFFSQPAAAGSQR